MAELERKMSVKGTYVTSLISVSTYTFTWAIESIPKWEITFPKLLSSAQFFPGTDQVFYASLQLKSADNHYYLTFHQDSGLDISVRHVISVGDCMNNVYSTIFTTHKYTSGTKSYTCKFYATNIQEFINASKNNVLIFKCEMELSKFTTENNVQKYHAMSMSPMDNLSALSADLKTIYSSSLHADINLRVDGEIMRVHKNLLCARSPVFAKMFETPMNESEKNSVDIPDLQLPVLKDLVAFLYSGTLSSDDFESVYALYYAADKYDVPTLRNSCVDVLLSKLDVANACSVLTLAERHSNNEFKKSVMEFIENNFDNILDTEVWDKFVIDQTQLASEVMGIRSRKYKKLIDQKLEN